jgi:hypothetical protein
VKKGIRIVFNKKQKSHAEPLLKKANILSAQDTLKYHQYLLVWNLQQFATPKSLKNYLTIKSSSTRSNGALTTTSSGSGPLHQAVLLYNFFGSSYKSKKELEEFLISKYYDECQVKGCDICN